MSPSELLTEKEGKFNLKWQMFCSTAEILAKAERGHYAIGSFNTSNVDVMRAIFSAAQSLNSPVMIETSEKEMAFDGANVMAAAFKQLAAEFSIPASLHLDHGKSLSVVQTAISAGYKSVHIDASLLPYEENAALTEKVVELAHSQEIFVEGELGHVPGSSESHQQSITEVIGTIVKTDPDLARKFYSRTKVDCLAASVGNVHGLYQDAKVLDFGLIRKLKEGLPCFLSLHGSSGIPEADLKSAIEAGITKINVNTELRVAYIKNIKTELAKNPDEVKPYEVFPPALLAVEEVVKRKISIFGSENKAF
ncbi:MAG: class II fructose-bisphosphate aldolase [Patescibacteria group bacterium]